MNAISINVAGLLLILASITSKCQGAFAFAPELLCCNGETPNASCNVPLLSKSSRHQGSVSRSTISSSSIGSNNLLRMKRSKSLNNAEHEHTSISTTSLSACTGRRHMIQQAFTTSTLSSFAVISAAVLCSATEPAFAATTKTKTTTTTKCKDIDSCREIGERKDAEDLRQNPIIRLPSGGEYKMLQAGTGTDVVKEGTVLDMTYTLSQASGSYMYSQGFGYEKIKSPLDGITDVSDLGLDSVRVVVVGGGRQSSQSQPRNVPLGIEEALLGMKRGEKRRVTVPPSAGFVTSDWKPEPITRRGKVQIINYKSILEGGGSSRPPFPAPTIWDIQVEKIRS
jgi:FKBP-type peptidyl-prolyl cis-trans isomerase